MSAPRTPSQTIGPFFLFALDWPLGPFVVPEGTPEAIRVHGHMYDGRGEPIPDGLVETWQADPSGGFACDPEGPDVPGFRGFGRCPTDGRGHYQITTLKPGALEGPDGRVHAPHIVVSVFARGLLRRLTSRIYFGDEEAANAADPVLSAIHDPSARATLVALPEEGGYRFDFCLQGANETVFFDL